MVGRVTCGSRETISLISGPKDDHSTTGVRVTTGVSRRKGRTFDSSIIRTVVRAYPSFSYPPYQVLPYGTTRPPPYARSQRYDLWFDEVVPLVGVYHFNTLINVPELKIQNGGEGDLGNVRNLHRARVPLSGWGGVGGVETGIQSRSGRKRERLRLRFSLPLPPLRWLMFFESEPIRDRGILWYGRYLSARLA